MSFKGQLLRTEDEGVSHTQMRWCSRAACVSIDVSGNDHRPTARRDEREQASVARPAEGVPRTISIVLYGGGAPSDDAKKELVDTTLVGDNEFPTGCPTVGWQHWHSARRTMMCRRV